MPYKDPTGVLNDTVISCNCNDQWYGDSCGVKKCLNGGTWFEDTCDCIHPYTNSNCSNCLDPFTLNEVGICILECITGVYNNISKTCVCRMNWLGDLCQYQCPEYITNKYILSFISLSNLL